MTELPKLIAAAWLAVSAIGIVLFASVAVYLILRSAKRAGEDAVLASGLLAVGDDVQIGARRYRVIGVDGGVATVQRL